MRKRLKSISDMTGGISAEAAIASAALIILFAVFISLAGYFTTAARVREFTASWLDEGTKAMHATGIHMPLVLKTGSSGIPMVKDLVAVGAAVDGSLRVTVEYDYCSVLGEIHTFVTGTGTLWMGDGLSYDGQPCVWNLPPAERGSRIEKIFGGNLPEFFPVADIYNESVGTVTSIISIDTTLDVYITGKEIHDVIMEKGRELMDFKGAVLGNITIKSSDISYRKLLVVIPENPLSDIQETWLGKALDQTYGFNIAIEVKRFQTAD